MFIVHLLLFFCDLLVIIESALPADSPHFLWVPEKPFSVITLGIRYSVPGYLRLARTSILVFIPFGFVYGKLMNLFTSCVLPQRTGGCIIRGVHLPVSSTRINLMTEIVTHLTLCLSFPLFNQEL